MKKVLVINTVNMGYTGITSVIMNYVRRTYESVNYDFVLCGNVEKIFEDELISYGCNVFLPPCSRVRKPLNYYAWLKKIIKKMVMMLFMCMEIVVRCILRFVQPRRWGFRFV